MNELKHLPVAAFSVDGMGKICAWNDAAAALCGKAEAEVLGKRSWVAFATKRCNTIVDDVFESGANEERRLEIAAKAVTAIAKPLVDETGEVTGATVVLLPAETSATERRELYRLSALDRASAVIEFEMDGTIIR